MSAVKLNARCPVTCLPRASARCRQTEKWPHWRHLRLLALSVLVSRSQRRQGGNEEHPCPAELDKEVTYFSMADRGIRQHRLTDAFGLTCRVRSAEGEPSPLAFAARAALQSRSSASISNPRASTANNHSQPTPHRQQPSAPKQRSGLSHLLRDGANRSNPLLSLDGDTHSTNGFSRTLVTNCLRRFPTARCGS